MQTSNMALTLSLVTLKNLLRQAKIAVILSSVSKTLLLLRNNLISLYQSSNFVQSLLNHPRSGTILFGITACIFWFVCAGVSNISMSNHSSLLETSSVICKNPSHSDNVSILSVYLELVLVLSL